ncbi:MAG: hypothetical protein DRJ98_08395 [Thermoprotei archaeon]|nr:MAG: hypothetical protein DRJ98_08395 [Thermoprotei archaeon]
MEKPGLEVVFLILGLLCLFLNAIVKIEGLLLLALVIFPAASCWASCHANGIEGLKYVLVNVVLYSFASLLASIVSPVEVRGGWGFLVGAVLTLLMPIVVAIIVLVTSLIGGAAGLITRWLSARHK